MIFQYNLKFIKLCFYGRVKLEKLKNGEFEEQFEEKYGLFGLS